MKLPTRLLKGVAVVATSVTVAAAAPDRTWGVVGSPASSTTATVSSTPSASCTTAISWRYAGRYVGRVMAVKGRIVNTHYAVHSRGRPTFLNFRSPYQGAFTALIWSEQRGIFGGYPENLFLGKTVCVTGKITWHRGPQIVLRYQNQIRILR